MVKVLKKWNHATRQYEPYVVPKDWKFIFFTDDMNELTTCPHCGERVPFGETYTSKEIHTDMGFGYFVCEKCYMEELEREKLNTE